MAEIKRISARQTYSAQAVESVENVQSTQPYRILDLNTYSDVGASTESATREVLSRGRRPVKGSPPSRSDAFGYNIDNTVTNVEAQMAAFFCDVPSRLVTTRHFLAGHPKVTAPVPTFAITDATTITLSAANAAFTVGSIIAVRDGVNDRRAQKITAVAGAVLTVASLEANEPLLLTASSQVASREIRVVGALLDDTYTVQGYTDRVELSSSAAMSLPRFAVGEWVFLGGAGTTVGSNEPFYARISGVSSNKLVFDATTRPIATSSSAVAAGVPILFGVFLTDDEDQITFTHMRNLAKDADDKLQVETVTGCAASELAINVSERAFVNMDFTYIGSNTVYSRLTQAEFDAQYATLVDAPESPPVNTSTDVYRQRLVVQKEGVMNTAAIHGLVQEFNVTLNNNLSEATGIGILGNAGTSQGAVGATGTMTAYFVDLSILEAVRCNCTAGVDLICARKNEGFVLDVPALSLSSNGLTVADDNAVQIDVDKAAFKSKYGFVLSYTSFAYLPDEAMPPDASNCDC